MGAEFAFIIGTAAVVMGVVVTSMVNMDEK